MYSSRFHKKDLHDLYSSPNTIREIKSRRMRWAGHVAGMGRVKVRMVLWLGDLTERNNMEDLDIHGKNVLRGILRINFLGGRRMD